MIYDEYLTDLPFEQRVPLIKTAVFCFEGKYPENLSCSMGKGTVVYFYLNLNNDICMVSSHHRPDIYRGRVCTKEEFYRVMEGGL